MLTGGTLQCRMRKGLRNAPPMKNHEDLVREGDFGENFLGKEVEYPSIDDADLLNAIDRMRFDKGDTEIFVKMSSSKSEGGPLGALDQKLYKEV